MCNHLQNQIKYYYPSKMNKHLNLASKNANGSQGTSPDQSPQKFLETFEKQRKIIEQTNSAQPKARPQPQRTSLKQAAMQAV